MPETLMLTDRRHRDSTTVTPPTGHWMAPPRLESWIPQKHPGLGGLTDPERDPSDVPRQSMTILYDDRPAPGQRETRVPTEQNVGESVGNSLHQLGRGAIYPKERPQCHQYRRRIALSSDSTHRIWKDTVCAIPLWCPFGALRNPVGAGHVEKRGVRS